MGDAGAPVCVGAWLGRLTRGSGSVSRVVGLHCAAMLEASVYWVLQIGWLGIAGVEVGRVAYWDCYF